MIQSISALWRRVVSLVGRGRLRLVNDAGPVQLVQGRFGNQDVHDDLPNVSHYGFHSNPPPGTDAVALFVNGERTTGVVIATNNQTYRLTALASGEVALADNQDQIVYLSATGIKVATPLQVTIDTPSVHITGNLVVDGDAKAANVTAVADVKDQNGAKSMAGMRGAYNAHGGHYSPGNVGPDHGM